MKANCTAAHDETGTWTQLDNRCGSALCEMAAGRSEVITVAQYFHSGEFWGLNALVLEMGKFCSHDTINVTKCSLSKRSAN
jgi:hypothetical protein